MEQPANTASVSDDAADALPEEVRNMSVEEIKQRTRLIGNEVRVMRSEANRIKHELKTMEGKTRENNDKIKKNKKLPYLVATVLELPDVGPEESAEGGRERGDQDHEKRNLPADGRTRRP